MDVDAYIQAKSDQLNADDLISGPIVVTIERVTSGTPEQPVVIHIGQDRQPWRPSKTALRTLVLGWGTSDTTTWVGRQVELYRDPSVLWGGVAVGGIRVSGMSHIRADMSVMLTVRRGKKEPAKVRRLVAIAPRLDAVLAAAGLTRADVDAWLASSGRPSLAEGGAEKEAVLAGWLTGPGRLDLVRAAL